MAESRILIVDDDEDVAQAMHALLSEDGYACEHVPSAALALEALDRVSFDLVLSDMQMSGLSGMDLLDRMRASSSRVPLIFLTGFASLKQAVDATKHGAFDYVSKPLDAETLRATVTRALDGRRSPASSSSAFPAAALSLSSLVGEGEAMRLLREKIELVAQVSAPVLVLGESGTGKELVARAIPDGSTRRSKPFVGVNVSAIPEQLLESEIFGHVRGAFTGAHAARRGLVTEAHGGTLLLDEIGDMPIALQAKLLRVLQLGEVRAVGADKTHHVDVRVIAATHRDLIESMRANTFREDLYFRLNVVPIVVPPLREHPEDIPALAAHFLARALERFPGSPVRTLSPEAVDRLKQSPWPGNVRELESAIERLVILVRDETIIPSHLSFVTSEPATPPWKVATGEPWSLKRMNAAYVEWVLTHVGGDKIRAAELLGVNLSTLYRWQRARPK